VVSVVRGVGLVLEVEFVEVVAEIQIQASLGRLRRMDFPELEQALWQLFGVQGADRTVVEATLGLLRLQEGIETAVAYPV
jgi:hypothetical protein